jgi:hypothetical protein
MSSDYEYGPATTSLIVSIALASTFIFSASLSWAGSICYEERLYPSVVKLEKTGAGIQVFLGGKFFNGKLGQPAERIAIIFTNKGVWQRGQSLHCPANSECLPTKETKAPDIPPIALSKQGAIALVPQLKDAEEIEQTVSDWTEQGGNIWFGISFYSGEGVSGIGGIGRFDPLLHKTVIRRPKAILNSSIHRIVHDGEWLWFGTVGHYECTGDPPTHGLLRYKWDTNHIESFEGKEDGPCGFAVHDLLLEQQALWVATDLGLSRFNRRSKTWDHFVPDPAASPPMKPTSCAALYSKLLNTIPQELKSAPIFSDVHVPSQLFESLKQFRPQFLTKQIENIPPSDLTCDQLTVLAARIGTYETLKTKLLVHHPVGSPNFICIMQAYNGKDARSTEIRDLLLSSLMNPKNKGTSQDEAILDLLQRFPGDSTVGEVVASRLHTMPNPWREAELLPSMLGTRSVPHLIAALERFTGSERQDQFMMRALVTSLAEATGIVMSPNGFAIVKSLNDARDRDDFNANVLSRVAAQWRTWWDTHKTEYASGLPDATQLAHDAVRAGKILEPQVALSKPTSLLAIGTVSTHTATVINLADPAKPPIPNFPLTFQVKAGPHADVIKPIRGMTDAKGTLTVQYTGLRSGEDSVLISHDGDNVFMKDDTVLVRWGGPDLIVPAFLPPVLMTKGGNSFFISEWTQNIGEYPAGVSTTHYLLSPTSPVDLRTARVIGKRTVPPLRPGERSDVWKQSFVLPQDLPAGTYYLAACADAIANVLESNEQNNCSVNPLPGQAIVAIPSAPVQNTPR